jgi:transcriptional regulator with XRE-family HTH domain
MDTSGVRKLRFALEQKIGRRLSLREVAEAIGMDRSRLNKLELNLAKEIRAEELIGLRSYFSAQLERPVIDEEIVKYALNSKRGFGQALALCP